MLSGEAAITNVQSIIRPEWIEPTRYLVYCSLFSIAAESMQKMGRQTSPMFEIDLGVSVFCHLIG
jgi:hypothetical protein